MKTSNIFLISMLMTFAFGAQAFAGPTGSPQNTQEYYDLAGLSRQGDDAIAAYCKKITASNSTSGKIKCDAADLMGFVAGLGGGLPVGFALAFGGPAGIALGVTAAAGDHVATGSYNYVNSSTSKALVNLGNDPSEQGSYLWNAEHQPDPAQQRRQEMQDAMAAQGIYDDTPTSAAK